MWIWWLAAPEKLSRRANAAIAAADRIGLPTVSVYEVAALSQTKRIELDRELAEWLKIALAQERVETLPLTAEIALQAALLEREGLHRDPADRIICATARLAAGKLVTRDERLRGFDPKLTVW